MMKKNIPGFISLFILLILFFYSDAPIAAEHADDTIATAFWDNIYLSGGWTLYCGYAFDQTHRTKDGKALGIEQIYPVIWMIKYLKCGSRMQCRQFKDNRFIRMESDLHNMYPVWTEVSNKRGDSLFGIVEGEYWRFDGCDFERKHGITEPRPIARGNIARSIFYMNREYGLPVDTKMLAVLKRWNREDPPSTQEKQRNDRIESIQGNRNPFIDNPALAEKIRVGSKGK